MSHIYIKKIVYNMYVFLKFKVQTKKTNTNFDVHYYKCDFFFMDIDGLIVKI